MAQVFLNSNQKLGLTWVFKVCYIAMRMMAIMTRRQDDFTNRALAFRFIGIGWYIAFCLGAGFGGGYLIDRHYDTLPLFSLILLTLGLVVAIVGIYRMVKPLINEAEKQVEETKANGKEENN